ncbi:MAG: AAA family ATPase [Deltaproteobacteria bacterium]|nr:AAA family ATPase [Deltaproteobacteria bacterium]
MLKRFYVENYRCLGTFELKPEGVVCLVGPNGGGKSTVFQALQGIQAFLQGSLVAAAFPPFSWTRWDQRQVQKFELEAESVEKTNFRYELEVVHTQGPNPSIAVKAELLFANDNLVYRNQGGEVTLFESDTTFPFDETRSFIPLFEPKGTASVIAQFKRWASAIWLFALRPFGLSGFADSEANTLSTDGLNLAAWYRTILQSRPEMAQQIVQSLRPVVPGLVSIRMEQIGRNGRHMFVSIAQPAPKGDLTVEELSDGQRCLLLLYAILHGLAASASVLVFDEPDNFVAEQEIQPWLAEIRRVVVEAGTGTLIVLTHHPAVIDYLAAGQTLFLSRPDGGATRQTDIGASIEREDGLRASEWLRNRVAG